MIIHLNQLNFVSSFYKLCNAPMVFYNVMAGGTINFRYDMIYDMMQIFCLLFILYPTASLFCNQWKSQTRTDDNNYYFIYTRNK